MTTELGADVGVGWQLDNLHRDHLTVLEHHDPREAPPSVSVGPWAPAVDRHDGLHHL
jgi:hypothetical protein